MKSQETFTVAAPPPDLFSVRRLDQATLAAAVKVCESDASPAARRCAALFRQWMPPVAVVQPAAAVPVHVEQDDVAEAFVPVPA